MEDFNTMLAECGLDLQSRIILCYYFRPETLRAVIDSIKDGGSGVEAMQSQSEAGTR